LAVSVVNYLTVTVTQYADGTALCVFKCSLCCTVMCCRLQ